MKDALIYHVCRHEEWQNAQRQGRYSGSSQDQDDGFIHCATKSQVVASTAKHRAGQDHLVLVVIDTAKLPPGILQWEYSRSGKCYPHLYGDLPLCAVQTTYPITLSPEGKHQFPLEY